MRYLAKVAKHLLRGTRPLLNWSEETGMVQIFSRVANVNVQENFVEVE